MCLIVLKMAVTVHLCAVSAAYVAQSCGAPLLLLLLLQVQGRRVCRGSEEGAPEPCRVTGGLGGGGRSGVLDHQELLGKLIWFNNVECSMWICASLVGWACRTEWSIGSTRTSREMMLFCVECIC
jgi:hypothetical protein